MNRARACLAMCAALLLAPHEAAAQAKKKKGGASAGAAVSATPAAAAGGAATAAPADGGDLELEGDGTKPAVDPAAGEAKPEGAAAPEPGSICEISPELCPQLPKIDPNKEVRREVYAVQQNPIMKIRRFEVSPYWGFSLNDQFVSHVGPGLAVNYYISNVLAVGVAGNFYQGLNVDSDFNFRNRRATRVAVPLTEYQFSAAANMTYVPVYGKFAGFSSFIFHYDVYVSGGVGLISTRPLAVIDPDNRKFDWSPKLMFDAGLGLRIFLTRWLAANLEIRDYIYPEKLEALTIQNGPIGQPNNPSSPSNPDKWLQDGVTITNNVQAQLGVSIFFPFSFNYRLAK